MRLLRLTKGLGLRAYISFFAFHPCSVVILAQAYLAFDRHLPEENLLRLAEFIFESTEAAADKYLSRLSVQASVQVEEGSVKTWAKFTGKAAGVIASAIIGYGGLRTGIDYIYKDARAAANLVNTDIIQHEKKLHREDLIRKTHQFWCSR